MLKNRLLFALILLLSQHSFAQSDCSSSIIICGNTPLLTPQGVGDELEQLGCGNFERNSVWLSFQAKASGKLSFVIRPVNSAGVPTLANFDWSLFQLAGTPNSGNCNAKTQISCNSNGVTTAFGIAGATGMAAPPYTATTFNPSVSVVAGTWYSLLIDHLSTGTIPMFTVQFTGNPENEALNSTAGIFDNRPDFTVTKGSNCDGSYTFNSAAAATSGITAYLWNFGDGTTSTAINPSHTYASTGSFNVSLSVTDNNGCTALIRKQVVYNTSGPTLAAGGILLIPSCTDADNGSITVNTIGTNTLGISGGTPSYTYELVAPSTMVRASQSSGTFTGLAAGRYTIKATDACGRSAVQSVNITQISTNSTIGLGIQNIQSACGSSPTGAATIFANGTVPPYTMQLVAQSPVTTSVLPSLQRDGITSTYYTTFENLLPGVYTVEATDACGKKRRATFAVTPSTTPTVATSLIPSCGNTPTGKISITATAGTGLSGSGSPGAFQYALVSPSPITRAFQTSSVFEHLPPGTYTVAVKDACGNVGTTTSTISAAASPTLGTTVVTPSCANGTTGSIMVQLTGSGGGTPYSYELVAPSPEQRPAQSGSKFENLRPGAYTIKVTDACGRSITGTATVATSAAPGFTTTVVSSCAGVPAGSITVVPGASAAAPFTFELTGPGMVFRPFQGSNVPGTVNSIFTGLYQGTYTVKMTDACNVPVTGTVVVTAPSTLVFPAGSSTLPSCGASSTGSLLVSVPTTGVGGYKYELIAPSPETRPQQYDRIFTNLPAGDYTVRITDSCGSQVTIGTPLTIATAAAPSLTVTTTSSCATASGTITCLPSNANQGNGPYQYALVAPSAVTRPNQSSPFFTGLPDGSYTVQITDQCGLTGTVTASISAAGAFSPAAGGSVVSCNGSGYNAQIIVTNPQNYTPGGPIPPGSGGGPYTYALYNFDNTILLAGPQTSNIFNIVVPATGNPSHTVRVTDACGNTSTATLAVNPPAALNAAVLTVSVASCASGATGVIRVSTSSTGGLAPYSYSLIDAATSTVVAGPQTGTVFNGVPASATGYTVRTTDACGNTITSSTPVVLNATALPTGTAATTASCASGATGSIVFTPSSANTQGGGPFTYTLYDAGNTTQVIAPQTTPVFSNVAAGSYTIRVTDVCGNTGTVSATVASGIAAPTAAGTASGTCSGLNNGVITASSTGGSLPVTYTLVNQVTSNVVAGPQTGNIFEGLASGTYIVRVTDACGSITNSTNIVVSDLASNPTITTAVALDCDGFAIFSGNASGGNGGSYTYAICNGAGCTTFGTFSASNLFNITSSGTYRIAVRDRCGNQAISADVAITVPTRPVLTGIVKANVCGATSITPSYTGITTTALFSIDGSSFSATLPTSIAPGCHTIQVADENGGAIGCPSAPFSFSVIGAPALSTPNPTNWSVNCGTANVVPGIETGTGSAGCSGDGYTMAVKLTACTGCNVSADAIGSIKAVGASFFLEGATEATFVPLIVSGSTEICSGTPVSANFTTAPFSCGALPIQLLSFSAHKDGEVNKLAWSTAMEVNNKGFEIQRSADGTRFNNIGYVFSNAIDGNSAVTLNYSFTDFTPAGSRQYYRLKQEDNDGKSTFSQTVLVRGETPSAYTITSVYPNPAVQLVNIGIAAPEKARGTVLITDITGKPVLQKAVTLETGHNVLPFNIAALANGTYFVKLICNGNNEIPVMKFLKN